MNNNILVTGGAGFIGSHIVEELIKSTLEYDKIVILDNFSTGKKENIINDKRIEIIDGDISDLKLINNIFDKYLFDYVFHFAAIASVNESIDKPIIAHKVNFDATLYLLEKLKNQDKFKRIIFASSAAVYGDNPLLPCKESNAVNPISPYGVDKYASERFIVNYNKTFNVYGTAFRFFNVYGERQDPSSPYSGVISIFSEAFKKDNPEIKIYGDGTQTRDFIYVKDLVKIIIRSLDTEDSCGNVYNLCTNKGTTLLDIVKIFENTTGKKAKIRFCNSRAGDIKFSYGDNNKIMELNLIDEFVMPEKGMIKLIL